MEQIYKYQLPRLDGTFQPMEEYQGKVLLIVNTATMCGFTWQYEDLQKMQKDFHDEGFEVLDIPCNQFMYQAPEDSQTIHEWCLRTYGITFQQFLKSEVNGVNELPLYTCLKSRQAFHGFHGEEAESMDDLLAAWHPDYRETSDIKWNFTKFLVDRSGHVIARFEATEDMADVRKAVEEALA